MNNETQNDEIDNTPPLNSQPDIPTVNTNPPILQPTATVIANMQSQIVPTNQTTTKQLAIPTTSDSSLPTPPQSVTFSRSEKPKQSWARFLIASGITAILMYASMLLISLPFGVRFWAFLAFLSAYSIHILLILIGTIGLWRIAKSPILVSVLASIWAVSGWQLEAAWFLLLRLQGYDLVSFYAFAFQDLKPIASSILLAFGLFVINFIVINTLTTVLHSVIIKKFGQNNKILGKSVFFIIILAFYSGSNFLMLTVSTQQLQQASDKTDTLEAESLKFQLYKPNFTTDSNILVSGADTGDSMLGDSYTHPPFYQILYSDGLDIYQQATPKNYKPPGDCGEYNPAQDQKFRKETAQSLGGTDTNYSCTKIGYSTIGCDVYANKAGRTSGGRGGQVAYCGVGKTLITIVNPVNIPEAISIFDSFEISDAKTLLDLSTNHDTRAWD